MGALATHFQLASLGANRVLDWSDLANETGAAYGVEPALILAVISVESGGNPNLPGRAGEIGLMQIMPATGAQYGANPIDLWVPATNIDVGTHYLSSLLARFGGDYASALAAYGGVITNKTYVPSVLAALETYRISIPSGEAPELSAVLPSVDFLMRPAFVVGDLAVPWWALLAAGVVLYLVL